MDDTQLKPAISHLATMCEKLFEMNQEQLLMIVAFQYLLDEPGKFPGFRAAHQAKIQDLRQSEFGKVLDQDKSAFRTVLRQFLPK
jgi:hypothetical protein